MRRILGALASLLVAAVGLGTIPATAAAAPIGTVLVIPVDGPDSASIRLRTSAGCPQQAKNYYARLWGKGFPAEGQVITTTTAAGMRHDGGFDVYLSQTMKDFAALAGGITLGGTYKISVYCIDKFPSQVLGEFTGSLEFATPTAFRALGASRPTGTPPPPLKQGGVELPEAQGGAQPASPGAPAPGAQAPARAKAAANAVPAEPGTNLFLLVLLAVVIGPAIWAVLAILRRRRATATETVSSTTAKGSDE